MTRVATEFRLAHALDVAVVLAGARRAQHQKVSASSPNAQPSERLVKILSSAHQGKAGPRHGRDIRLIPHAKILVGGLLRWGGKSAPNRQEA